MSQSLIRLVFFYFSWFAVAAEASMTLERRAIRRQQSDSSQFCSVKTCGAASADTCDQQLNTRVLGAPDRGSQPAPGRWADSTNYGGNVDSFFRGEVAKLQWSQQDIVSINGADVTSKYIPFKNEPKSLAALGFCGCVGVIVMSRSAVWMAHITEDPVLTNEATFKRNGLDVLENGSGTDDMYYGLADLKDNVFAANQDPVIIVFAPKDESGEFKYRNLMAQVDDLVENSFTTRWLMTLIVAIALHSASFVHGLPASESADLATDLRRAPTDSFHLEPRQDIPDALAKFPSGPLNQFLRLISTLPAGAAALDAVGLVLTPLQQSLADAVGIDTTENGLAPNATCADITVIFARGTTEPGNVGLVTGPPFFDALKKQAAGKSVNIQGVAYPATFEGFNNNGTEGVPSM
ncbi:hypothetical protein N0V92_011006 [Colletotrichum tropicale]|nr:hypothetical protein N0V92_011006 [Colletotrichum tropicale]